MNKWEKRFYDNVKRIHGNDYSIIGNYVDTKTKIKVKHNRCDYVWDVRPSNFIRKKNPTGCPKCAGTLKKSSKQLQSELDNMYGTNVYKVIGEYINSSTNILIKHNKCGNVWSPRPYDILGGKSSCPECLLKNLSDKMKKTHNEFKKELDEHTNGDYDVLSEYVSMDNKIKVKHKCGHIYKVLPSSLLYNEYTGNCESQCKKKIDSKKFKEDFNELYGKDFILLDNIEDLNDRVRITHKKCNTEFTLLARYVHRTDKFNCPNCNPYIYDIDKLTEMVQEISGDEYTIVGEYQNMSTAITFRHNECGNEWKIRPTDFVKENGNRCPDCAMNRTSRQEKEVIKFLEDNYSGRILLSDNIVLEGKELDIYLPDENLAIEYNGLYWHSEEGSRGKCDRHYHKNKTMKCRDKNIQLIHIFENEWVENSDIIKDKLLYLINKNYNVKRIYGRKCEIIEVEPNIKRDFLNENHIQGNDRSILNLAIKYDNDIVGIMTFSTGVVRRGKNDMLELSRYATKLGTSVIGGFSKVLKHLTRNYDLSDFNNTLITYADLRYSYGDVYVKNGWIKDGYVKPSYYYTKNNELFHKSLFKKNNIKKKFPNIYDKNLSERDMMKLLKYNRVWDSGKIRYKKIVT